MTLTLGTGPFAVERGGTFNFTLGAPHGRVLYLEDVPWRIRAEFGGETLVDSRHARRLHETGYGPVLYFPMEDIRTDLFHASDSTTHCPFKGDARYWSIHSGGRTAQDAVWNYPEPIDSSPIPADHVAFYYDAVDRWLEEDEEIFAHPTNPYHRVDVRQSSRHARVLVDGNAIAETERPTILAETGLPARYYLHPEDVRSELLFPSGTRTQCPYKGEATYYSLRLDSRVVEDIAWNYHDPRPEGGKVAGYFCFLGDPVELELDDGN